jgi:hypothetical protein
MRVRRITRDQLAAAVERAGVVLTRPLVRREGWWRLTIRAKTREDRARGYRALQAKIFEASPAARIEPCWVGGVLLYGTEPEEPTVEAMLEAALGPRWRCAGYWPLSADRLAEYNRKPRWQPSTRWPPAAS